jgi:hypothetical protein
MSRPPLTVALVSGVLVALAFGLNPSAERHRERIKAVTAERSPIAGVLGLGALAAFTSSYHSLGVASYTTVAERTVSIGALSLVYVLEPDRQP